MHLGMDLFLDSGSNVPAPLDGIVHIIADNAAPHPNYGSRSTTAQGAIRHKFWYARRRN